MGTVLLKNKKVHIKPEYLWSYDCLNKKPAVFFDYFRQNLDCRSIEPNDAHSKSLGCRKMFLMTNTGNASACRCYEKAGGTNAADDVVMYEYKK